MSYKKLTWVPFHQGPLPFAVSSRVEVLMAGKISWQVDGNTGEAGSSDKNILAAYQQI